ncbi:nitrate reductase cytochrome c-type subunit [Roseibium salinum]|uniref:Periplasmic nitrate reductase, electron transfer subunit n=1 Tax=Roseibium salinum TaxID=1604349 RepID=A0ABT3QZN8_9HYPH|nr:nitrate reductase cytochrome c-type subunit [Roseibium sp. DSM 29163]MCX2722303.1 nitrate reductase cytochrome c-type subunit [Roseibium sp. DSM 29163]MDN3719690.1 nitrate reductase cytochrome c-type subunit [Roseibium salinum]
MKRIAMSLFAAASLVAATAFAQENVSTLRPTTPLAENDTPAPMAKPVNSDLRQVRNYPEQPPLIPHSIDNYQIDMNVNKCLTCHSRTAIEISQAPMVSITHFMNRENQFLASVTPRRYFCTQCHVPQTDARPLVENDFVDVDAVLDYIKSKEGTD